MNLVIDIGNTAIKTGWFEKDRLLEKQTLTTIDDLKHLINVRKPSNVIASSTSSEFFKGTEWQKAGIKTVHHKLNFPFTIKYKTPDTLGTDRLCAVAGAVTMYPEKNILIINLGTCITYDFVNNAGEYFGGAISPGVLMRFRAMNKFTARLPDLSIPPVFPDVVGNTTSLAMESGVMNGTLFEMEGMIREYRSSYGQISVIITGGSAHIFEKKFKEPIFAAPDLVLIGLNVILQRNASNF